MKHFRNCATLILVIFCIGNVLPSTHMSASEKHNPLVALGFARCASDPCFLKIIPGRTNWKDVALLLLPHNFTKDTSDMFFYKEQSLQGGIYIKRVPDEPNFVNSVSLSDLGQIYKLTLDDVLDLYGFPCSVGSDFIGSFWFAYPNMLVNALSDNQRNPSKAAVIYLKLVDPQLPISTSGVTVCEKTDYSTEYQYSAVINKPAQATRGQSQDAA
jgi:hypothetical protein